MAATPYRCIDADGIVWELSGLAAALEASTR